MTTGKTAGRRRGRPPKGEAADTKGALLEAALRLFAQKGYAATSIRAIAHEVGLSESVLYAHFSDKRAIFDAAVARLGPQAVTAGLAPADAEREPAELIHSFVEQALAAWDTPDGRLFTSLVVRDGLLHDPTVMPTLDDLIEQVAGVLARWIEAGRIRGDLGDPADLAYSLVAPLGQARLVWLHAGASPAVRRAARRRIRQHAEFFVKAVTKSRGSVT